MIFRASFFLPLIVAFIFAGCETTGTGRSSVAATASSRKAMMESIAAEPRGAYFVGRRYYKTDYKFWGFVRKSGEPWTTARLVMMSENSKLIPDRASGKLGTDNNHEYKLSGFFSGDMVYEPASNAFYPEFVLKDAQLISSDPAPIYRDMGVINPERRVVPRPY